MAWFGNKIVESKMYVPKVSQDFTWIIIHCEEYVNFGAPKVRLEEISYHKSDSLAVQLTLEFLANHKSKPISNKRWIKSYYFEVENQCNIHQRVVFIAHCCANIYIYIYWGIRLSKSPLSRPHLCITNMLNNYFIEKWRGKYYYPRREMQINQIDISNL